MSTAPFTLAWACAVGLLPSQHPAAPAAIDLEPVREAFAAAAGDGTEVALVLVGDAEPLLLTAGADAGARSLDASSLLPLGSAARLLVADAVLGAARTAVELDTAVLQVAGRDVSTRKLLEGSGWFPDWFASAPVEAAPDRQILLACAEVAVNAVQTFRATSLGMAEIVLLRDHVLDERAPDWPSALRTRLSPRGAGIDPIDVATLDAAGRGRVAVGASDATALAAAAPECARLALSLHDLQQWWCWRLQQDLPALEGDRGGYTAPVEGHAEQRVWNWTIDHGAFHWVFRHYPGVRAALVAFGKDSSKDSAVAHLQRVLETCLFGPPQPRQLFGGRALARPRPGPDAIAGDWVPVAGTAVLADLRLDVDGGARGKIVLHWRGRQLAQTWLRQNDRGYAVELDAAGDARVEHLLLWRDGEGSDERLRAAFVERTAHGAVPRRVDFVRAK